VATIRRTVDDPETRNRAVAEHVARLRERLLEGQAEIERQRAAVDETHEHLAGMSRWIEQANLPRVDGRTHRLAADPIEPDDAAA
jgi:hypothetical protein